MIIFHWILVIQRWKKLRELSKRSWRYSFIDDFNKLEAYAQKLRDSDPGSDVVINIFKDALEQGKRRFSRIYVYFQALKNDLEN